MNRRTFFATVAAAVAAAQAKLSGTSQKFNAGEANRILRNAALTYRGRPFVAENAWLNRTYLVNTRDVKTFYSAEMNRQLCEAFEYLGKGLRGKPK